MTVVPILLAIALGVLAFAFGLHCLVLHCDEKKVREQEREHQARSPTHV
jgi:hypothetical protein